MLHSKYRISHVARMALWLAAAGFFVQSLSSQEKPAAPPPSTAPAGPTVFHLDTRVVVCHATVVDKSGHLVTTLPKEAFTVLENGVKQEIRVFKREDVPVSLGLVIDNSGSMRNKLAQVK